MTMVTLKDIRTFCENHRVQYECECPTKEACTFLFEPIPALWDDESIEALEKAVMEETGGHTERH